MKLTEDFYTMDRIGQGTSRTLLLSIYINPTKDEMRKYIAIGARGFIDLEGNLYLEGYEETESSVKKGPSQIMHGALLSVIHKKDPTIVPSVDTTWTRQEFGVTVQREMDTLNIYIGESVGDLIDGHGTARIKELFTKAQIKNPKLTFVPVKVDYKLSSWSRNAMSAWGELIREGLDISHAFPTEKGKHFDENWDWEKTFQISDTQKYVLDITLTEISYNVEKGSKKQGIIEFFAVDPETHYPIYSQVPVGIKTMYRIFATVASEILECYKVNPDIYVWAFSATKEEDPGATSNLSSRMKAYRTMAEQLAKKFNWVYVVDPGDENSEAYFVINPVLGDSEIKDFLGEAWHEDPPEEILFQIAKEREGDSQLEESFRMQEFKIEKRGDKWVVLGHKGDVKGTHDSESKAKAQIAAIYANGYREASTTYTETDPEKAPQPWMFDLCKKVMEIIARDHPKGWPKKGSILAYEDKGAGISIKVTPSLHNYDFGKLVEIFFNKKKIFSLAGIGGVEKCLHTRPITYRGFFRDAQMDIMNDSFDKYYYCNPAAEFLLKELLISFKEDLAFNPLYLREDAAAKWETILPEEYAEELLDLVQTAYQKAPLGSFIKTTRDVMQSDWKATDIDNDQHLDATIFYRAPRAGEPWTKYKIQGIGHDGSREAITLVLHKLEEMLRSGNYWIEASDAMEHVLYKRNIPYVSDEAEAKAIFPLAKLSFIGDQGKYTRLAGGVFIQETIFGNPGIRDLRRINLEEGMSPNYDNSFPRQNSHETLDTAGSREAGLEMTDEFSFSTTYEHALERSRQISGVRQKNPELASRGILSEAFSWERLDGSHHHGMPVETDGNILFIHCDICDDVHAIEDGIEWLEEEGEAGGVVAANPANLSTGHSIGNHTPEHMLGSPITLNHPGGKGVSKAKRGKNMSPWDKASSYVENHEERDN